MPFLQATFCLKGFDDRSRFFATSLITLLGFVFLSAIFSDYLAISLATLLLLTVVLACSTKRRLHDAKLNKNWQTVPGALFLLTGMLSLFIESSSSHYFLILPALSIALLLTYPSKNGNSVNNGNRKYILGYYGPVDLTNYQQDSIVITAHQQRIEPTLASDGSINEQVYLNESVTQQTTTANSPAGNKQADIGELIRLKLLGNRKFQLGIIACVSLIFIAVLINSLFNSINQQQDSTETNLSEPQKTLQTSSTDVLANKAYLLSMPDNFNLYLSTHRGIIIHWQADLVANGELWSQLTTKGDKSCQAIKFNKGDSIRPLAVSVENGSDYFASFSPLDSKELIQALAFRGKFSLCGYGFSLKGSQAVLGKHVQYAPFLDKDA